MLAAVKESLLTRLIQRVGATGALLSSRRVLLFAYDEMMSQKLLETRGVFSERSVLAWIEGFAPAANVSAGDLGGSGRLGLTSDPASKVWGVTHEIGGAELLMLDGLFWAAGNHYERQMVEVTDRDGYERRAWVYVAKTPTRGLSANQRQVNDVIDEAKKQGLPDYYVEKLAALTAASAAAPALGGAPARSSSRSIETPHTMPTAIVSGH